MKFLSTVFVVLFLFTGCETNIETRLTTEDILSKKNKIIESDFFIELPSCNDFQDSRKPSSALIEAKKSIPYIFDGAKYKECYSKQMTTFAVFKIPVLVNNETGNIKDNIININTYSNQLMYVVPASIKKKMDEVKSSNFGSSIKLSFYLEVINNTKKDFTFTALSTYINNEPCMADKFILKAGDSYIFKPSDVSVSTALNSKMATLLAF